MLRRAVVRRATRSTSHGAPLSPEHRFKSSPGSRRSPSLSLNEGCPPLPRSAEQTSQFVFGLFQAGTFICWELTAGPVDIEVEHRHRRTEWIGLTAVAGFGGTFERLRNLSRVLERKYAGLEIQCVACLGDALRPPFVFGWHRLSARRCCCESKAGQVLDKCLVPIHSVAVML